MTRLALIIALCAAPAFAQTHDAAQVYVHDGDTVHVGAARYRLTLQPCHLSFNAPELSKRAGQRARSFLHRWVDQASRVDIHDTGQRSGSRIVAVMWIDGVEVGPVMIAEGLAEVIENERWCRGQ